MIPANLVYNGKIESSPARRFKTNIQPQNGTGPYSPGNTITINIPCNANTFLIPSESYLKFQLNVTVGGTASISAFDAMGAHGVIQRLRVYHGSSLLQDIDNYNDLAKILFDYQAALDTTQGRLSITNGTNPNYAGADVNNIRAVNKGLTLPLTTTGAVNNAGTYCINLLSVVGALAGNKYLPLHFAQAAPLRVEIVLVDSITKMGAFDANATAVSLSNVEYIGEFLQMSSGAIDAIAQRAGGALQMVVPDWRNYTNSFAVVNNTTISIPVAAKFSSLKSLVVSQRQTAGAATYYPCAHVKNGLAQWTMRIGSEVLPSTAPSTDAEFFSEAAKCFGSLADMNYQPSIDLESFKQPTYAVATADANTIARTDSGAFLVGLDCETYQNVDKSGIFAGMDTTTSDIFVNMVYGTVGAATTMLYNAFACFDNVLVFENGVIYSRT